MCKKIKSSLAYSCCPQFKTPCFKAIKQVLVNVNRILRSVSLSRVPWAVVVSTLGWKPVFLCLFIGRIARWKVPELVFDLQFRLVCQIRECWGFLQALIKQQHKRSYRKAICLFGKFPKGQWFFCCYVFTAVCHRAVSQKICEQLHRFPAYCYLLWLGRAWMTSDV